MTDTAPASTGPSAMNSTAARELYQHAGLKLKLAREQSGQSIQELSDRTKLTPKVLRELEAGEGDIFSTPVYVRGQLRSYARALGVDIVPDIQQLMALDNPAPVLQVRETTTPTSRAVASAGQYALYFLVTALVAVPVISSLNLFRGETPQTRPLDGPAATAEAAQITEELPPAAMAQEPMVASTQPTGTATTAAATVAPASAAATGAPDPALAGFNANVGAMTPGPDSRQPIAASLTGLPSNGIVFRFNQDSWVKFIGPNGSVIEQGLQPAGTVKQFAVGQLGKARIGAAEQVQMIVNGQPADITGFTKGSVANLTIGTDGRPVAASR